MCGGGEGRVCCLNEVLPIMEQKVQGYGFIVCRSRHYVQCVGEGRVCCLNEVLHIMEL